MHKNHTMTLGCVWCVHLSLWRLKNWSRYIFILLIGLKNNKIDELRICSTININENVQL